MENYASIDIGTNAIKMLIKQVYFNKDKKLIKNTVQELRIPIRLGVDVFNYGFITEKKIESLCQIFNVFKTLFEIYNVKEYKCYATSAMREATNSETVIKEIKDKSGFDIEVITGVSEANTISLIASDYKLDGNYVFIDVGGGSTEVSLFSQGKIIDSNSYPLGTIRILSKQDKKKTWKEFYAKLDDYYARFGKLNIIGTGGNINRYYKIDYKTNKKPYIKVDNLEAIYQDLKTLNVNERIEKYKIKPDRADVIIPAGKIYLDASHHLHSKYIIVPLVGLNDAIIDILVQNNLDVL